MLERFILSLNLRGYLDVQFPLSNGLLRGEKIEELIRLFTHGKTFMETKIPLCCVAVDAETGKLDVLEDGLLHEAVRASMSIPAIFEPKEFNGRTYIDGGVLERVPCKCLRDRGMDVVIGVVVGYHGDPVDVAGMNAYQAHETARISIMQWEMTKFRCEEADVT
jgi:NTE family protein